MIKDNSAQKRGKKKDRNRIDQRENGNKPISL